MRTATVTVTMTYVGTAEVEVDDEQFERWQEAMGYVNMPSDAGLDEYIESHHSVSATGGKPGHAEVDKAEWK